MYDISFCTGALGTRNAQLMLSKLSNFGIFLFFELGACSLKGSAAACHGRRYIGLCLIIVNN